MNTIYCPVCLSTSVQFLGTQTWKAGSQTYELRHCTTCGSAFTTPLPEDNILKGIYGTVFDYRWYQDHYDAKLHDCRQRVDEYGQLLGSRILDFGGGMGYLADAISETGRECRTYDPFVNAEPPELHRWDTVIALHVLEHSNNLERTMEEIKSFLTPNGRIILAVPNFSSQGYKRLGMDWVWAQPPFIHVFHFTADGLNALLRRHGFHDIQISFHERWDANLYCDLTHAHTQRRLDSLWSLRPLTRFTGYRRWVAKLNAALRSKGLEKALRDYNRNLDIYAELQITAVLSK